MMPKTKFNMIATFLSSFFIIFGLYSWFFGSSEWLADQIVFALIGSLAFTAGMFPDDDSAKKD